MEYNPRQVGKPPSPLEPMGFFTGVKWRPVITGVVVDVLVTFAASMLYDIFFVAKDLGDKGAPSKEALGEYWSSGEGLMACSSVCSARQSAVSMPLIKPDLWR